MLEIRLIVDLPGIPEAINRLADAMHFGNRANSVSMVLANTTADVSDCPAKSTDNSMKEQETEAKTGEKPFEIEKEDAADVRNAGAREEGTATQEVATDVSFDADPPKKKFTFKQISSAGAKLCSDLEKMDQLISLLNSKYGVTAITMIPEERYPDLAADLVSLGGVIEEE